MAALYFRFRPYLLNANLKFLKVASMPSASGFDVAKALSKREVDLIPIEELFLPSEEKLHRKALRENYLDPQEEPDLTPVNSVPENLLDDRVARIHKNGKNVLQSGTSNTKHWRVSFLNEKRWDSPLMGWGASADALSCLVLKFETAEDAVSHCEENGWKYFVDEAPKRPTSTKKRSYRDNFLWDKRTRVSTK